MKDKTVIANPALAHSNGATSAACTRRRHGHNVGEISIWAEGPDHAIMNGHSRVPERHREPLWRPGNLPDSAQTLFGGCPLAVVDVMAFVLRRNEQRVLSRLSENSGDTLHGGRLSRGT